MRPSAPAPAPMEANEEARNALLAQVKACPGAHTRTLAAAVGLSESTAAYHLKRLAKMGQVHSTLVGRDRCWFLSLCGLCPVLRRALPVLRRPTVLRVAKALDDTPRSAPEIAEPLALARGTVRWATLALANAHLAERSRGGRTSLREGADVCLARATTGQPCDLWGRCPVSVSWLDEQRARLTGLRAPPERAPGPKAKAK